MWDPNQYATYGTERMRPALDLVRALPPLDPQRIVDLGCGRGELARLLADRFPQAAVTGVDSSPEMLAVARQADPAARIEWRQADIGTWDPESESVDLIISNAALHWLPDHASLFHRLLDRLARRGVLAVQMPRNFDAPSHSLLREVALTGAWADRLAPLMGDHPPVHPPGWYADLLLGRVAHLDLWETSYHHLLTGPDPVFDWVKGTALRPIIRALAEEPALWEGFAGTYADALRTAYPMRDDGITVFAFRRLFIIATAA